MFIGIDIGSSSVKVMAISGETHVKYKSEYPAGTSPYEHDPAMVLEAVRLALKGLLERPEVKAEEIQGIGLDGHGPSIIFLDRKGEPLTPIVTWQDNRASKESAYLREHLPRYAKNGTSYEAKLLWFHNYHPELFIDGIEAFYPKDYLVYKLCGVRMMDSSTASTILYYDRKAKDWSGCRPFFNEKVMPKVFPSWEVVGVTDSEFSRSCGLPDGIPIIPGGIDAFCEAVGSGGIREGIVVDGSGTSTCLTLCMKQDGIHSEHVLPDMALMTASHSSTGSSYKWLCSLFPQIDMAQLQQEVDPSLPINLIYLPYLMGERSPIHDDYATGVFLGMRPNTSHKELLQAVMQGVAFGISQSLDLMDYPMEKVRAVGGANSSDLWLRIKANASRLPYEQMAENDGAAFGSALLAAYGTGTYSMEELDTLLHVKNRFDPVQDHVEEYRALRDVYEGLYPKIKEDFAAMYGLRARLEE